MDKFFDMVNSLKFRAQCFASSCSNPIIIFCMGARLAGNFILVVLRVVTSGIIDGSVQNFLFKLPFFDFFHPDFDVCGWKQVFVDSFSLKSV